MSIYNFKELIFFIELYKLDLKNTECFKNINRPMHACVIYSHPTISHHLQPIFSHIPLFSAHLFPHPTIFCPSFRISHYFCPSFPT